MKRVVTAAVTAPLALAAVFYLPGFWFFLAVLVVMEIATVEYIRLARHLAPAGPHRVLLILVPSGALALVPVLWLDTGVEPAHGLLWVGFFVVSVVLSTLVLLRSVPAEQALTSLGSLAFGTAYLALPVASLYYLQQLGPWVLVLLFAVVWLGDTAAYYFGKKFGERKLAPRVSPNKTWVGSIAGLVAAVLAAAVWSYWQLGSAPSGLMAVAVLTSIAAQIGDLVESMIKRGAGVKDSGALLPGHGGVLDRVDALLFAAPVMLLGLHLLGSRVPLP